MRLVPVSCVKEGNFLARTIYDSAGRVLLARGVRLSAGILRRIEKVGILSIYINDRYSDNEIEDIIKPELRQKAIKTVKNSFDDLSRNINQGRARETASARKLIKSQYQFIDNLNSVINDIVDEILARKNVLVNLVDIKSMDNYTYEHCVNVVILSLVLGVELGMNRNKLYYLAMGAMLHDMGKVFVPKEVLLKNGRLTDEEFAIVKEHPEKGYEYLRENMNVSAMSRIIVLQHHERVDGTGYPNGIKGDRIHEFSRAVSVVDVYDALTSDRPYRKAIPPSDALEYIMGSGDRYFDFKMVNAFMKKVVPYPEGTMVRLSDGSIGVVEEVNQEYVLRPRVRVIYQDGRPIQPMHIDMMKEKNIVIGGIEYMEPADTSRFKE